MKRLGEVSNDRKHEGRGLEARRPFMEAAGKLSKEGPGILKESTGLQRSSPLPAEASFFFLLLLLYQA